MTSSNDTNVSEISSFRFASNITPESNARSNSNGSIIFVIDDNYQKLITSNKTCLNIKIANLIISEGLYFNLSQNQYSRR